jgi:hypothetical protein
MTDTHKDAPVTHQINDPVDPGAMAEDAFQEFMENQRRKLVYDPDDQQLVYTSSEAMERYKRNDDSRLLDAYYADSKNVIFLEGDPDTGEYFFAHHNFSTGEIYISIAEPKNAAAILARNVIETGKPRHHTDGEDLPDPADPGGMERLAEFGIAAKKDRSNPDA